MRDRSEQHRQDRQAQERGDLDALLQQAIRSRTYPPRPSEEMFHAEDDTDSHRRGLLGRSWARLGWEWEFGAWRRWWLQLVSHEGAEVLQPRWAVAQALTALVLPGTLLYLFLLSRFDVTQIVIAMQIGLSMIIERGW